MTPRFFWSSCRDRHCWLLSSLIALGILLDLGAKALAREWLSPGVPLIWLPGVNLNLGFNPGVAFGMFAVESSFGFAAIVTLQVALITLLLVMFIRTASVAKYCYAAMISGAVANLLDRLAFGAVTDYIDLHVGSLHWPTFNLADIFISLGVVGLILLELPFDRSRTAA